MDAFVKRTPRNKQEVGGLSNNASSLDTGIRPAKKQRVEEIPDSESDESEALHDSNEERPRHSKSLNAEDDGQEILGTNRPTDVESALPETHTEAEAIQEYESFKLSQSQSQEKTDEKDEKPAWVRGKSSIYVDAFNLALDTVLDEESHLFDSKEKEIFQQWRDLNYEAQFL